ncbi:MAG: hypothetical protein KF819_14865 [Labilithrix sp.]|nr:hypothetical protein [Labilithrix sp.]
MRTGKGRSVLRTACRGTPSGKRATLRREVEHELASIEPIDATGVEHLRRLAAACSALTAGFTASAKHARDAHVAEEALTLAEVHRALQDEIAAVGAPLGLVSRPTSTSERLRWEWLASTAAALDGAPDARMLQECARLERDALAAASALAALPFQSVAAALRRAWAMLERLLTAPASDLAIA